MDKALLAKRILRSLCANDVSEQEVADSNYRVTVFNVLKFSPLEEEFLTKIQYYYQNLGGPPNLRQLNESLNLKGETELSLLCNEVNLQEMVWGANYQELIQGFATLQAEEDFRMVLSDMTQIVSSGKTLKVKGGNEVLRGVKDAISYGVKSLTESQRNLDPHQRPLTKEEALEEIRTDYIEKQLNPTLAYGLGTGLTPIDESTKGAQNKELWLIAGFTSHGKSTFALNWARYLAVEGGFNIMVYTLEMNVTQVWRLLAVSHSAHPKWGRPPVDYGKVKAGILTPEDSDFYINEVIPDLRNCDGNIEVLNPRGETSMSMIKAQAELSNRDRLLDLLIIDYPGLVGPDKGKHYNSHAELVNSNIKASKQLAMEFDNGKGIVVAITHQINRQGLKKAMETGGIYETSALADANEAERSPDAIYTIYQDEPLRQKHEAVVCNLKTRDGAVIQPFNVYCPSQYRLIGELEQASDAEMSSLLEA